MQRLVTVEKSSNSRWAESGAFTSRSEKWVSAAMRATGRSCRCRTGPSRASVPRFRGPDASRPRCRRPRRAFSSAASSRREPGAAGRALAAGSCAMPGMMLPQDMRDVGAGGQDHEASVAHEGQHGVAAVELPELLDGQAFRARNRLRRRRGCRIRRCPTRHNRCEP